MPDPQSVHAVLDDLRTEGEALDALVAGLDPAQWATPTPAEGWTVAHQIAHLAWTDARALLSMSDPAAFAAELALAAGFDAYVDKGAQAGAGADPAELLARWREGRARVSALLRARQPGTRAPWFGPPMSVGAMAGGRLMETWAHGEDVADALGVRRAPTARLWHVARLAFRARDYAYGVHGVTPPAEEFRVELTAPDGSLWTFGPREAAQRVSGPALDFCLLAVRRRHRDDLALRTEGADAGVWLSLIQAFAGPPGKDRLPSGSSPGGGSDVTASDGAAQ